MHLRNFKSDNPLPHLWLTETYRGRLLLINPVYQVAHAGEQVYIWRVSPQLSCEDTVQYESDAKNMRGIFPKSKFI